MKINGWTPLPPLFLENLVKDFLNINIQSTEKLRNGKAAKMGAKTLSRPEKKLNSKSAAEKAEKVLNLYHRSPKTLRNCQHQLPLEAGRMRCMKKLLKTGGWIKFCLKIQLRHQIPSLLYSAGRLLLSHPDRRGGLFSGEVAYLWTGNIRWI